jgi:hypothetical protein
MRIVSVNDLMTLSEAELVSVVVNPQYSPAIRTAAINWWKLLDSQRRARARHLENSLDQKNDRAAGNGHRPYRRKR